LEIVRTVWKLEETPPKMKGVVQAKRYVGDLTRIPLGKEGQGTLKAIWFRVPGCFNLAKASSLVPACLCS